MSSNRIRTTHDKANKIRCCFSHRYGHLNPINFLEGIHRNMGWIKTAKLDTEEDYIKYIQRLEALPRQVGIHFFSTVADVQLHGHLKVMKKTFNLK